MQLGADSPHSPFKIVNTDPVEEDLEFFLEGAELKQHRKIMARRVKLAAQKERAKAQRRFREAHKKLDREFRKVNPQDRRVNPLPFV